MTKIIILLSLLLSHSLLAGTPVLKEMPLEHIYAPSGFDSNDISEVVITGYLPNMCHKSPEVGIHRKGDSFTLKVEAYHYEESNPFCPEVIVPFVLPVKLGILEEGQYKVSASINGNDQSVILAVKKAQISTQDDFMYAGVQYIMAKNPGNEVLLIGQNPSDCFDLKEVRWISNGRDTYSVLPILEEIKNECPAVMTDFSYSVEVPDELKRDKVLLHTRSMKGDSVNHIHYRK